MSEDGYGLDKAERLAGKEMAETELPVRLEPKFPFVLVSFDSQFWE